MRASDDITELAAALVTAQADMPNVPKETMGQVGNQRRAYADLATVTDTVRPILARHGLAYVQAPNDGTPGYVAVTTRLMHASGQWIEETLSMPFGNGGAQAVGSAITYARRYSLMALLGLAPDDDDDGAAASASPPKRGAKKTPSVQLPDDGYVPPGAVAPPTAPPVEGPSKHQTRHVMALFGELGITDRAERLTRTGELAGRTVESWNDVTPDEAERVIAALTAEKARVA